MSDDGSLGILKAALAAHRALPSRITVAVAVEALTGCKVLPIRPDDAEDVALLELLTVALDQCILDLEKRPIVTSRVNEAGNLVEERVKGACEAAGFKVEWPTNAQGGGGRAGYPDLLIHDAHGRPTYLELKMVGPAQENTTFRSFYMSPSEQPKVSRDARHLLVAFQHMHLGAGPDGQRYGAAGYSIVDLAAVIGQVKFEYQSSNRAMYSGAQVLGKRTLAQIT